MFLLQKVIKRLRCFGCSPLRTATKALTHSAVKFDFRAAWKHPPTPPPHPPPPRKKNSLLNSTRQFRVVVWYLKERTRYFCHQQELCFQKQDEDTSTDLLPSYIDWLTNKHTLIKKKKKNRTLKRKSGNNNCPNQMRHYMLSK